ncbi:MAG: ketoacyl-ACP synthase III [Candidatus Accumulibacter sp.]|jgi:3-oxoacyl-[acyl-carrier-protein] synthase-3|nr:ketoacyl-ACP synthase III [Accumulibacter sp.]
MLYARITGVGAYLPGSPISNDELARRGVATTDEWIFSRTGIRTRHLVEDGRKCSDLAFEASLRALEAAKTEAAGLDLIVVATTTPDFIFPSTACLLQAKLGNVGAMAFDVQAVCGGFVYALTVAEKFIRSGSHRRALVVGADVFSSILDWQDRTTCVLFGDGAGAVVLEASEAPGILGSAAHADGSQHGILAVAGQVRGGQICGDPFVRMDGQAVFRFAVRVLSEIAHECCGEAGIAASGIDWLIPHQANVRIIESTAKKLGLSRDKVVVTVDRHGNTSAASIPLALEAAVRDGRIQRGQKVLLEGVGAGVTWGAVLLEF